MNHPSTTALILTLLLTLTLSPTSCSRETTADDILNAMCQSQNSLPAGQIYHSQAAPGEKEFADAELRSVSFGKTAETDWEIINHFAFRLSTAGTPHEFAVFVCVSAQDAYDVAQLCLRRSDILRRGYADTAWAEMSENAQICVSGRYVLMAVGEAAADAIDAGRRAMR